MTYDQFWHGNPWMARDYRKADEIRRERRNEEMWLQGMYFYEALCDVAPVMQAFAKKGTKVHPYAEQPYAITENSKGKYKKTHEEIQMDKTKKHMEMLMASINQKFASKAPEGGTQIA